MSGSPASSAESKVRDADLRRSHADEPGAVGDLTPTRPEPASAAAGSVDIAAEDEAALLAMDEVERAKLRLLSSAVEIDRQAGLKRWQVLEEHPLAATGVAFCIGVALSGTTWASRLAGAAVRVLGPRLLRQQLRRWWASVGRER